jgi:hypothetical protein
MMGMILVIAGGLIIGVGTLMIVWDVFVLIGGLAALVVTMVAFVICWVALMVTKFLEWKKGRSEQGWEPTQTGVHGGDAMELDMSMEEAARLAAYVVQSGGSVHVNVVDDVPIKDVTPRRSHLRLVKK